MYNPTCYEFKIHFPFIFPSSCCFLLFLPLFSLVVGYNFFVCFFLSWFMFLELSYKGCRVHLLIIGQKYFVLGEGRTYLKASAN